jgi:tRNA (cytidine/uridine-2'-O-)-methyltransferase
MMVAGSPTGRFDARCFCTLLNRAQGGRSGACEGNLAHAVGERHLIPAHASLRAKLAAILARMRLALCEPDISQNTGTILRMAACLGVPVDVIGPTGFDMTDRALKRAALDYLDHVEIARHASFAAFEAGRRARGSRLVLLTTQGEMAYTAFAFQRDDTPLLGRESAGVPPFVHRAAYVRLRILMRCGLRSLNVAVAAAIVLGEALRQVTLASHLSPPLPRDRLGCPLGSGAARRHHLEQGPARGEHAGDRARCAWLRLGLPARPFGQQMSPPGRRGRALPCHSRWGGRLAIP